MVIARKLVGWSDEAKDEMGVNVGGEGGSATACIDVTPMVNNAKASAHAAVAKAFAYVVRLHIENCLIHMSLGTPDSCRFMRRRIRRYP